MNIRWAILPGIIFGSLCVFFLGNLIAGPDIVLASNDEQLVEAQTEKNKSEKKKEQASASEGCEISPAYNPNVRQWCDIIQDYSREAGLDPNLVAALITQESGGDAGGIFFQRGGWLDAGYAARWPGGRFYVHQWTVFLRLVPVWKSCIIRNSMYLLARECCLAW